MLPLNKLLDKIERGNKKDSWDFTGGHLNHNHLFKPPVVEVKTFWRSGQTPQKVQCNKLTDHKTSSESDVNIKKMKDAFAKFTLKTSLVQGTLKTKSVGTLSPGVKHTGPATPINTPFVSSVLETQSFGTCKENLEHEYYEESLLSNEPEASDLKSLPPKGGLYKPSQYYTSQYTFMPNYLSGLTKSDQFRMFLQFDKEVIQRPDLTKDFWKNTMVEKYEKQLTKELLSIAHIRPPHFARLQIFSNSFGNICNNSSVFGNVLMQVKDAYDSYVDYLLDIHSSLQHRVLLSEIVGMKKRPVRTRDVDEIEQKVKKLEQQTLSALYHNDQLRNSQKALINIYISDANVTEVETQLTLQEEKCEKDPCFQNAGQIFVAKRSKVLELCRDIRALEEEIREKMTHVLNAEASEHYTKDVQSETVKLQSSNAFLQRANKRNQTPGRILLKF
ncbi:uncharacterized protein C6orf118 homolog isoform X2 [Hyperolius riggenbachi]|uniref:uncharacterized protein C6orf118 homolog isoform X2 n=1 Tax=Hyperolius riggenbachi TaxID=752182 RepID=UPI0035A3C9FC